MINKDNAVLENDEMNEIIITDEVIQSIAAHSVKELDGVSLITSFADGIMEKIVKKNGSKAVRVSKEGKNVSLEVHISIKHGIKIPEICATLQANIKKDVEEVTDFIVEKVHIFVDNVTIENKDNNTAENNTKEEQENQ